MSEFYAAMPLEWREVILSVAKYTDNRTDRSNNAVISNTDMQAVDTSGITATYNRFFLLSEYEVFGEITHSHPGEAYYQAQYSWFKNRIYRYPENHALHNELISQYKNDDSDYVCWWLRSPRLADNQRYCRVNEAGQPGYKLAYASSAIVPCFVIR